VRPSGAYQTARSFENQARQAKCNLFAALNGGGGWLIPATESYMYIVGVKSWPAFNRLNAEILRGARPVRSIVPVPEPHLRYLADIDAIAAY
jgi:2-iminobutanoate/2-iminopropanoate deaminase